MMSIDMKHEIIGKHEQGVSGVNFARQYEQSTSTICTILKRKGVNKGYKTSQGHHGHLKTQDFCS